MQSDYDDKKGGPTRNPRIRGDEVERNVGTANLLVSIRAREAHYECSRGAIRSERLHGVPAGAIQTCGGVGIGGGTPVDERRQAIVVERGPCPGTLDPAAPVAVDSAAVSL